MLKKRNLIFLSLLILGVFLITGCWLISTPTYIVTFDSQGGSTVNSQTVEDGELVTEPTAPMKAGYTFAGWYKELECINAWDFVDDMVTSDVTLYAKWATNTYTVTFNKNGGDTEANPKTKTATYGGNVGTLPTAPTRMGYTFGGWNTKANGSGTEFEATTAVTADITVYAQWTPLYALRDTGPAEGLIFYVKAGGYSDGWMYLEAAPSDQSTGAEWGGYETSISGADGTAVGTGEQNTIDIEAGCVTAGTAADICANLSLGGYDDWFLPSKDELNLMYANLKVHGVGDFESQDYWSSSENDAYTAWLQGFYNVYQGLNYKSYGNVWVRAVRAF